jgi:hypothetical protein
VKSTLYSAQIAWLVCGSEVNSALHGCSSHRRAAEISEDTALLPARYCTTIREFRLNVQNVGLGAAEDRFGKPMQLLRAGRDRTQPAA